MDDSISRQAAIYAIAEIASSMSVCQSIDECHGMKRMQGLAVKALDQLPSAQPYTDKELQKIQDLEQSQFDKLYELGYQAGRAAQPEKAERRGKWIPDRTIEFETIGTWRKFVCDQCGNAEFAPADWDMREQNAYCRKCGARME